MDTPIDASALSRAPPGRAAPLWWGVALLLLILAMLTASFVVSYLYLGLYQPRWPPRGVAPPALAWPSVELVLLLGSGALLRAAERRAAPGALWAALLALGAVLALRAQQFADLGFRWDSHVYGSIVWATLGFHSVLLLCALLWLGALALPALRGLELRRRPAALAAAALFGYGVALLWVPVYLLLYGAPRWL